MLMFETYAPRAFRFVRLLELDGWRIKLYAIRYRGESVDKPLLDAAVPILQARLLESAPATHHYSVGFAAVHQGMTGNFAFIDWWADQNELHHHVYVSNSERPGEFKYLTPSGLVACVWDLQLLWFERQAWVDAALARSKGPDLDAYMACRFDDHA